MPDSPSPVFIAPVEGLQRYLRALAGFDRNVRLFLTVTAFRGMVIASLQTVFNLYLYSLGYDARFIGLINGVNSIAVLLVSVPLGYLADRFGRRPVLLVGGIGYPLSILGVGIIPWTPSIMLFNFLFGAFASAYWVAGVPLLFASTREEERVQAFSINSFLLWGLGPLGALLSGQVVEVGSVVLHVSAASPAALRLGMVFMALLAAAGAVPYPFLRQRADRPSEPAQAPPRSHLTGLFARLLVPDLVLAFGLGSVLSFMQLYFHTRFGLNAGPVGIIVAAGGLLAGAGTLLTPVIARRWGNLRSAVCFQWSAVPLMAVVALATRLPLAIPAYWGVVLLRGMSDPVYTAFVQERVPETYRARLTGLYSVTYSIGYSFGPAVSGQLQKVGGFTPAFLMGAGFYLLGAALLFTFFGLLRPPAAAVGRSAAGR